MSKESGERIVFYMRVSSEEQAERMTIGTQEEFLEQYRGLYGHEVIGIYKDEAISGTVPLRERPGGRYLLEDATEGAFDVVVEEEAAVVREVFSNIAGGSTLYREAQRLNGLGMPGPGWKYRGRPREHSARWTAATLSKLVNQTAYGGTHLVRISGGEGSVERECPPVVPIELQQQALARLAENKRHGRRQADRSYLLSGLIRCAVCGSAFVGHPSGSHGKTRYYYICNDIRPQNQKKAARGHAPYVRAEWIEDLVWGDVKRFLENPGEVLERLRERAQADGKGEALAVRHADLTKRLGQKEAEKDRYVRLYAQGHLDDSELATYLEDLKYQTQNLRLLLESVEAEIAGKKEQQHLAETTGVWLHTLRERTAEVEADTEEAQATRRELVRLLVEAVEVDRTGEGKTRMRITYRFGQPASPDRQNEGSQGERVHVVNNSLEYDNPLVPLVSVMAGLVVGEFLGIEETLKRLGDALQKRFSRGESPVSRAFVTTSLLFCVGPLTVIGSLEDGLSGDYSILALKSVLDFIAALTFASVLGWGVLLSACTVLFVQGSLALGAAFLDAVVTDPMISATTATGCILIFGLGLGLLGLKEVRVANMLSALLFAPLLIAASPLWPL
jgi:uncharacterized protein